MGDKQFKKYTSFALELFTTYTTFRHQKSTLEVYLMGSILQVYLKYT